MLLPAVVLLALAAIGFGVAFATRDGGGTTEVTVVKCTVGQDPGCKLRSDIHEHANFAVVINGTKVDFSQAKYVSAAGGAELSATTHIHEPRFGVVHVHLSNTTWDEFLRSLKWTLLDPTVPGTTAAQTCLTDDGGQKYCPSGDSKLRFFVNGVEVDGVAGTNIYDLDRVLITYGSYSDAQIQDQLKLTGDDGCIPSLRCPSRVPPNEPAEECSGKGACTK